MSKNKTNEATVDRDFDAAVVELRQGQRKGLLKFGAVMILLAILVGSIFVLTLSIGDAIRAAFGV